MADITAKLVMELRDETNLPMMKCKQALAAANGDKAGAIEWLRKQGVSAQAKFEGRETPNGAIGMAIAGGTGALVLIGCQTDFVASNDDFKAFAKKLAELALASGAASADALKTTQLDGRPVSDHVTGMIQKIGENIVLAKVAQVRGEAVQGYNHGGRIGALVAGAGAADKMRMVALHVASANPAPVATTRDQVDPALVKKEEEILLATPEVQGKPEAMRPKIVQGKLGRFYKERVLLEQEMLLDAEKGETVEKYAKRNGFTVTAFARLAV
jgi:elongation factor Ts